MKKIFTLLAILLCVAGTLSAQNFKVLYKGQQVKNGDRIHVDAEVKTEDYGFGPQRTIEGEIKGRDLVVVTDDKELTINFSAALESYQGSWKRISICPYGRCYSISATAPRTNGGNFQVYSTKSLPITYHCEIAEARDPDPKEATSTSVNVHLSSSKGTISFYIDCTLDLTKLGVHNATNNAVTYADGTLRYSFASMAVRTLSLTGIDGREIYRTALSQNGSFQLPSALLPGVYVATIRENGHHVWSKKLLK